MSLLEHPLNAKFKLNLTSKEVDTLSGLLVEKLGRLIKVGDIVDLHDIQAEVLELKGRRASKIRLTIKKKPIEER